MAVGDGILCRVYDITDEEIQEVIDKYRKMQPNEELTDEELRIPAINAIIRNRMDIDLRNFNTRKKN